MNRALDRLAVRGRVLVTPCQGEPELWDYESDPPYETVAQRAARHKTAADSCMKCHILTDCEQYLATDPSPVGVWAGRILETSEGSVESNAANIATSEGIEGKEMDINDRIKSLSPNAAFDILIATIVNQRGNGV
ncbi:Catalase-peroxidase-Peroxidase/catalase [Rhodococcus sp. AW25M09]|nr:Catalase-peroxidase-Peroxidase/catalase [Rhodococcus sp. AW25M09]